MDKRYIPVIVALVLTVIFCAFLQFSDDTSGSSESDSIYSQLPSDSIVADTDSVSHDSTNLGYPKPAKRDDWENLEDKADNDDNYDPYDDPDWDETTPGESRPEYFIRGNIPDPELYPEDEVKKWVDENGTEDEKRDVEQGNY